MLVFDATPLIYLAKAARIEELDALEEKKIVPERVYTEVVERGKNAGEPDAERIEAAVEEGIFTLEETDLDNTDLEKAVSARPTYRCSGWLKKKMLPR